MKAAEERVRVSKRARSGAVDSYARTIGLFRGSQGVSTTDRQGSVAVLDHGTGCQW